MFACFRKVWWQRSLEFVGRIYLKMQLTWLLRITGIRAVSSYCAVFLLYLVTAEKGFYFAFYWSRVMWLKMKSGRFIQWKQYPGYAPHGNANENTEKKIE
jgi:hypothetical protein